MYGVWYCGLAAWHCLGSLAGTLLKFGTLVTSLPVWRSSGGAGPPGAGLVVGGMMLYGSTLTCSPQENIRDVQYLHPGPVQGLSVAFDFKYLTTSNDRKRPGPGRRALSWNQKNSIKKYP